MTIEGRMDRKGVLRAAGGLAFVAFGLEGLTEAQQALAARSVASACLLTPEQEEGPYYVDLERIRNDIKEKKTGLPLHLNVVVVDATTCRPIANAAVDIWHCDAGGTYSGVGQLGTEGQTFLRGVQLTSARGAATFQTIYPGWYPGRATHIHLKVHVGGSRSGSAYSGGHVSHTGQLFFPDAVTDQVMRRAPYDRETGTRTRNAADAIYAQQGGARAVLRLGPIRKGLPGKGYTGSIVLGVEPAATPALVGMH